MNASRPAGACSLAALAMALGTATALAQGVADPAGPDPDEIAGVGRIGRIHDNLRQAAQRHALVEELGDAYGQYSKFKSDVGKNTGFLWAMDLSWLQQWGRPDGGGPAGQVMAAPNLDWTILRHGTLGTGTLQLSYTAVRYPTAQDGGDIGAGLGLITPINDATADQNIFAQLSYTHAFPGNKVLLTIGQYPFYNFDGNQYLANQQQNFVNLAFTQNASDTYPLAGLGAYAQFNATSTVQFAAGFQNPANITGATLSGRGFGDTPFAWFGYAQWTPRLPGMGTAQYSLTYYQVPTVPLQPRSSGWSVNAVQNLDRTWAVFGRANHAYDYVTPIKASYVVGGAMNNPLGHSATDQVAVALGYSQASAQASAKSGRRGETIVEAYWNWTVAGGLLLTPDVQYIRDPVLTPQRSDAWVLSLRATLMF